MSVTCRCIAPRVRAGLSFKLMVDSVLPDVDHIEVGAEHGYGTETFPTTVVYTP